MLLLEEIQALDDLELEGKRVFLRCDLDTPLSKEGRFAEPWRIESVASTVKKLQELGARVIVGSRFGEGRKKSDKSSSKGVASIEPAAAYLSELLECEVLLPDGCVGDSLKKVLLDLKSNQICVLENLLNEEHEGQSAEAFARKLNEYVDAYVGDSMRALAQGGATVIDLPSLVEFSAAGPQLLRELQAIARIRSGIDTPRVIIWGGNSLSNRVDLLKRLAQHAQYVVLVGVAGNTMLHALHGPLGTSKVEEEYLAGARTLFEQLGDKLILPTDLVCAASPKAAAGIERHYSALHADEMALDIGPQTRARIEELVQKAGTAIWCGSVGFQKSPTFAEGTLSLLSALKKTEGFTMVVGDDSVAAAHALGGDALASIDCVAQGGQATLALLDENKLLGLEALRGTNS